LETYAVGLATVAQNIVAANAHAFLAQTDATNGDIALPVEYAAVSVAFVVASVRLIVDVVIMVNAIAKMNVFVTKAGARPRQPVASGTVTL